MEEAHYDIAMYRQFAQLDLGPRAYPTRTPSFAFVTSWRPTNLSLKIMITINAMLPDKVLSLKSGTVVDAILMAAPPTTKNKNCNRDPEMHVSKKTTTTTLDLELTRFDAHQYVLHLGKAASI